MILDFNKLERKIKPSQKQKPPFRGTLSHFTFSKRGKVSFGTIRNRAGMVSRREERGEDLSERARWASEARTRTYFPEAHKKLALEPVE
ncbi:MAG: hypothetical protein PHF44_00125 [Candidatus Pacebacteria bacterium]|nr:hypothetical protein [Candidatus Paceibacterota bacterium]